MTPALFALALLPPLVITAVLTIALCRTISAASRDAHQIIRNRATTRRNYARAQENPR